MRVERLRPPALPRKLPGPIEIAPNGPLELLSQREIEHFSTTTRGGLYSLLRRCAVAVLNCGMQTDNAREILNYFQDFDIAITPGPGGFSLRLTNAPAQAFVDGDLVHGTKDHLCAVLRDLVYAHSTIFGNPHFDLATSAGITDAVFHILRHAGILQPMPERGLIVCWGGHAIGCEEYDYTKRVGRELGLRHLDVCTGCGPGAMKGPMKGAAVGHAQQRIRNGRYVGISEPGIIAAEPPNPMVNQLVVLPDMEKRLEAFVRLAHGIVVFPGGVGTLEEILYLLGILIHPANETVPFPLIFSGPEESADYWQMLDSLIGHTLGNAAQRRYQIVLGDPAAVARAMAHAAPDVKAFRRQQRDAYCFNWLLHIERVFQEPFTATHAAMAQIDLRNEQPAHALAANLRRAFSGIVAGNVKPDGIDAIERHGPFELHGDPTILTAVERVLQVMVQEQRMRLPRQAYEPCYRISA